METKDSAPITRKHITRVQELLHDTAIVELLKRSRLHDLSKFEPIEKEPLDRMQALIEQEGQAQYGTPEYKRRTDLLGPMIEHHRANNSHHPEYYENGIDGMDLFDVMEMFFDWKAASERGEDVSMRLKAVCDKYEVSPQLKSILYNTAKNLGYRAD